MWAIGKFILKLRYLYRLRGYFLISSKLLIFTPLSNPYGSRAERTFRIFLTDRFFTEALFFYTKLVSHAAKTVILGQTVKVTNDYNKWLD